MNRKDRIYMDHAATSWPKADSVLEAMDRFARQCGAAAGRGGYRSAAAADVVVRSLRRTIAQRIGASQSDCVSFHPSGTAALNAAIHGVVRPGDHVVVSAADHNSVLRPLNHLAQTHGVRLTIVPTDNKGLVDFQSLIASIGPETRLVALTHASNVTGEVQPIAELGEFLRSHPAWFLCDAAQTFGTIPISVEDAGIDLLAAPGHKSSGGPLGTAFLYASPKLHPSFVPWMQGGTGSQSESLEMPTSMPSMLEAGNLNVPALAGWAEAIQSWQSSEQISRRMEHAASLSARLHAGLSQIEHLRVHGNAGMLPVASVTLDDLAPSDAAAVLDADFGIETRAGMHCAARIHSHLGTEQAGTLRISAGHTSTEAEIDAVIDALATILSAMHSS
jgi:cysteine desulfurase family protein